MIDAILRLSLRHRALVLSAAAGLCVWGLWQASNAPVDVFPDLTAPTVTIIADAHGMAPTEVEALLTLPIETAVNGAPNVRRVRSSTSVGVAVVWVDFTWGTDIYRARQVVAERLQVLRSTLPPDVPPPTLGPVTSIMGDVLFVGLTSATHSPMTLRTVADWTLSRRLLAVPGVAQVIAMGGDVRQFHVELDPRKLDAFGLAADDVAHALETANENTSAGFLVHGGQEHLIHGVGRVHGADDIGATLVTQRGGLPVLVSDVARVTVGPGLKRGDAGVNGGPGVVLGVRKQPGANTLKLTRELERVLAELQTSLPAGMQIHPGLFRQASFIEVAVDNVSAALRDGAVLVVLIVLLFVASLRATIITAVAIPLSLLATSLALAALEVEINTMTLGGMAIAVGALVDDAIVDMENVVRRLRERSLQPPEQRTTVLTTVLDASREIRSSIVFATLIIVLVFVPLFFLTGVEGRLLQPLGTAYVVALGASLLVAVTVTPAMCSLLLPGTRAVREGGEPRLVRLLKRGYRPALAFSLRRWKLLAALSVVAVVVAGLGLARAGRTFLPPFNEGALTIGAATLPGTALPESNALGRLVEQTLRRHPEVVSTGRRTGRAEGDEHAQDVNVSEVEARLRPGVQDRDRLLAALREDLAGIPGVVVEVGQPLAHRIDHMLSGTRANIAVKLFGPDLQQLRKLGAEVRAAAATVAGVADLNLEQQADVPFVQVRMKRRAIARHGLRVQQVAHELETAFQGRVVTRLREGQTSWDVVVRYPGSDQRSVDEVRDLRVATPSGGRVPLATLAEVTRAAGPNRISRENVERKIVVSCNVAGRDLQAVVTDLKAQVRARVRLPPGYRVAYGGQFESAASASRTLGLVGAGVLVGIFVLLLVAIGSARDALLILVNLPLALVGGVGAVYATGGVVSVASIIGFITLFGIATRNGIMMVTHFQHLHDVEGVTDPDTLVTRGAEERLAPILMTALASGLGLLPLALAAGEPGSEIQAPMAAVILFGLGSSTLLNMLVVPALYRRFGRVVQPRTARP